MCPAGDVNMYRCGGFLRSLIGTLAAWYDHGTTVYRRNTGLGIHREERIEVLEVDTIYLTWVKGYERLVGAALGDEKLAYGDEASECLYRLLLDTRAGVDVVAFILIVNHCVEITDTGV